MILSQRQLEEIAASTTKDFNRFFFGDEADKPDRSALPTPIDQFAKNYLGLRVSFARLSPDGSICGVTAYADTEYKITELGITRTLALKRNQVILDESFIRSGNVQRLCAKRRFTLAHECAHQILFQLESEEVKASCEMRYSARTAYTPRELKTREDWNEWQANVLDTGAETTWDAMTASPLDYTPKDLNLGKMDMSGFTVPVPGKPRDEKKK